ncbi:Glu-tRNA(Gln) amidotransferase subunit GatE [Candidatus Woesearchaeota archaeon]|nr:Glu-tRNA(Gln) amidotransferase subunit GatE [Candidatus Woesearchaeota archaeon]
MKMILDYGKIGLKCGIEIHQQLDTGKLFCRCPSMILDDGPDFTFTRRLRAVIGETGEVDAAAAHEQMRQKLYEYHFHGRNCCLVDMDEEPPHDMDKGALDIVLTVSKMLDAEVVDEIQVMRKTVVDGSNTSGFQRTALVARNGAYDTSLGRIRVPTIMVEEDSCKIIEESQEKKVYDLSRLGIPLIEIGTEPDIKTPEHAKEAAEYLGMLLRSTKRVKRGLGTIRQDLNVSVKGGERIEIKGAQDLRMIPTLVEYEAKRQLALLEIKDALKKDFKLEKVDLTKILSACDSKIITSALKAKGVVIGFKLPGFRGLIGKELVPNKRLGTEFSDYAKVKAGVSGLFHSDELPKYGITGDDVRNISSKLSCKEGDAFILVADSKEKARKAIDAIFERVMMCFDGVPKEVRRANPDGTSTFMRPIPSAARMYPETDVLPVRPDTGMIRIPALLTDVAKDLEKILGKDLSVQISKSDRIDLFNGLRDRFRNLKPLFIAETILNTPKEIKKRYDVEFLFDEDVLTKVLDAADKGTISKDAVIGALADYSRTGKLSLSGYQLLSDEDIGSEIDSIIKKHKGLPFNALVGKVMNELRGKADGKKIMDILKKKVN